MKKLLFLLACALMVSSYAFAAMTGGRFCDHFLSILF